MLSAAIRNHHNMFGQKTLAGCDGVQNKNQALSEEPLQAWHRNLWQAAATEAQLVMHEN